MAKKRLGKINAFLICAYLAAAVSSCGKGYKDLLPFEGETGEKKPSVSAIADIEASILKYKSIVEKKVEASGRISYYYKMLGLEYMKKRMYGEAYEAYVEALAISPQNANLYYYAGICAAYMSKAQIGLAEGSGERRADYLSKAESAYKRSMEIDPDNSRTIYALAVLYALELSRYEEAAPLIETYMAKNVKDVNSRFLMARVRFAQGRYGDALELYEWIIGNSTSESERQSARDDKDKVESMMEAGR